LYLNRGFGFTTFLQLRAFCPSDVVEIVVKAEGTEARRHKGTE
jgi:predicted MPP superfamily phosphohydrolase